MSTTRTKTELVRMAWITALRTQGHRQCRGRFNKGNKVCALGLIREVAQTSHGTLCEIVGISLDQMRHIIVLNDKRRATFAEIADVVESWFATDKAA